MNDFTQQELKEIKRCLKYMIKGGVTPYSSLTVNLNKKIKELIDNYCEHKNREPAYDEEHGHHVYCTNCFKVYDVENK